MNDLVGKNIRGVAGQQCEGFKAMVSGSSPGVLTLRLTVVPAGNPLFKVGDAVSIAVSDDFYARFSVQALWLRDWELDT